MIHHADIKPATGLAFETDATELRRAVDYLARHVTAPANRRCLPALSAIRVETGEGAVIISACDLDIEAAISVPATVQAPGAIAIDGSTLAAVLKSAGRGAAISIAIRDDGWAVIGHGATVQTVPTLPARDMPGLRPASGAPAALSGDMLRLDLARVLPFAEDDIRRHGAMILDCRDGAFDLVATDGANLAAATRPAESCGTWQIAIDERAAKAIAKASKLWRSETVTVAHRPGAVTLIADRFAVTVKGHDDPHWGGWRATIAAQLGDELQQTFDPTGEPRLCQAAYQRFEKAVGATRVEIGRKLARLTLANDDSWLGISGLQPEGAVPKGYSYGAPRTAEARAYLVDLMERHGIEPAPGEAKLVERNGRVLGMTLGTYHHSRKVRIETVLDWENLVEREVEIVEHEEGWQPGAFSVVMPRVRESVCAEITVDVDGELIPLARHTNGSLYMTAEQVAAWCGPIDEAQRVEIPEMPMGPRWWKGAGPAGAPETPTGRAALMMTAEQMAAYARACAEAAEAHNRRVEPAGAPEASVEPVEAAPSVPATVEPIQAPEPLPSAPESGSELAELRSMLAAVSARLEMLERGTPAAEPAPQPDAPAALPRDDRARAVIKARGDIQAARARRDDAARRRAVRAYLQVRQMRARLSQVSAELSQVSAERAAESQRADTLAAELEAARRALAAEQAYTARQATRIDTLVSENSAVIADLEKASVALTNGRDAMRRAIDTEEALLRARARGDRLARIALGQRNRLERAAVDLRGARAEAGALRRRLAQASAPVSRQDSEPRGTMAVAFARA